jgi:dTDP-4-dehydrorhamnose reductase
MNSAQRVLIAGGNGMLAWDLARVFDSPIVLARAELDITSESSILAALEKYRPTVVLNCAAYTNVDGAETEREAAEAINARGPALLAKACRSASAKLVHFSTDQVFNGKGERPRSEDETPDPINHYAATKLRGEDAVLAEGESLVLRVQWLYGERKDRFSPLRTKAEFSPFADQFGAPTWTRKLAEGVSELVDKQAVGLFHFSYDDYASWAEVFEFVKQQWHLENLKLQPKQTSAIKLPAKRPLFSVLDNSKLKRTLGVTSMGSWKTPLKEFLSLCQVGGRL